MGRVWFLRTRPWPPRWWTYEGAVKADFLLAATVLRQFVHQADESAGIVPNAPQAAPASPPGGPGVEENSQGAETRERRRRRRPSNYLGRFSCRYPFAGDDSAGRRGALQVHSAVTEADAF